MSTCLLLVHDKSKDNVLLISDSAAGWFSLIRAQPSSTGDSALFVDSGVTLGITQEQLAKKTLIAEAAGPDWGHHACPSLKHIIYGLELDQAQHTTSAATISSPHGPVWIDVSRALDQWAASELLLTPPTNVLLQLLKECGSIGGIISTVHTSGLHLPQFFAPCIEIFPLPSPTIPPFSRTNTIFVRSKTECLVVDPGAGLSSHADLEAALKLRSAGAKVTVLLTHHHHDHVIGLPCIERVAPDALVLCHPQTLSRVHTLLKCRPASNEMLRIGDVEISLIFTPGHTDGHIVAFEPKSRTLLAGDHVVGVGSAVLDPECGDMAQYLHSTRMLLDLKPRVVYPAHGPPCLDGVPLLAMYIKHREQREAAILASYQKGNKQPDEIVRDVYTDVPAAMHAFAVRNVELHLRKLRQEARL